MRALVLGATGFVGRSITTALVARGADVRIAARDSDRARGVFPALDVSAVDAIAPTLEPLVAERDVVFNAIGYGVDRSERDETCADLINVHFVAALAAVCHEHGARLVHIGSALEYGAIGGDLIETSVPNATTLYGATKLAGTIALQTFAERTALRAVTARLFMLYGPHEHDGRLLPALIAARDHAETIPLTEGRQRRDFTYVGDAVEGLLRLADAKVAPGEIVNVATGRLTSVRSFVEAAAGVLGLAPERLDFGAIPTRQEEMAHDPVNVDRLRALTSWVPQTPPAEGVERTLASC